MYIVGIDTGGTFTDCIGYIENNIYTFKCLSTPDNPARAVLKGLEYLSQYGKITHLVHGTTVATNSLLEHKGGKSALVTTSGFKHLIDIGRQNRPSLYDLNTPCPQPLIPVGYRFEVEERVSSTGEVIQPLGDFHALVQQLEQKQVESVAVCFLFSYLNSIHEKKMADVLRQKGFGVSASSEVLPEFREYERFSTTIANAFLQPVMVRYIETLKENIGTLSCRIVQSNGGSVDLDSVRDKPIVCALSGPAAGAVGAHYIAKKIGISQLISFDMGGTSTDVALADQQLKLSSKMKIGGFPIQTALINIHTVGAGGGSVAFLDAGGALRVGPESAGANPGPICYGLQNDKLTVTDANLFLGRIRPEFFLGGRMKLHQEPVKQAMHKLAKTLKLSPQETAMGILKVANANMEKALRVVSVEQGYDPIDFTLVCFGGAGGLHMCELAQALAIKTIILPVYSGILSAVGMLFTDSIRDYSQTVLYQINIQQVEDIEEVFEQLIQQARHDFKDGALDLIFEKQLDLRYQGQSHELTTPYRSDFTHHFHRLHTKRYGYYREDFPVELVNIRLRATLSLDKLSLPIYAKKTSSVKAHSYHQIYFEQGYISTPLYLRQDLNFGQNFMGPALIIDDSATTLISPNYRVEIDCYHNIVVEKV